VRRRIVKQLVAMLAFVCGLVVTVVAAPDVAGTWNTEGDVVGNAVKFTCTLKQDGEKITGSGVMQGKEQPITGSIKDKTVKFEFDVDYEGTTYHNVYTGTLKDDKVIEGKIEVAGVEGVFVMKKQ
jgi:hypothetical protein